MRASITPRSTSARCAVLSGRLRVFGASNFPLAFYVAGGDTASALAAGCPVIVKAHPAHPKTSRLVGRVLTEVVPQGVFVLVEGFEGGSSWSSIR